MSLCVRLWRGVAHRVWVLAEGQNLAVGTPAEIQKDAKVLEAYLGQ